MLQLVLLLLLHMAVKVQYYYYYYYYYYYNLIIANQINLCLSLLIFFNWRDEMGDEQIFRLIHKTSNKWENLGLHLGLTLNQLDALRDRYCGDADACWKRVMDKWLSGEGSRDYAVSWEGLYSLLTDIGFPKVARDLKKAIAGYYC